MCVFTLFYTLLQDTLSNLLLSQQNVCAMAKEVVSICTGVLICSSNHVEMRAMFSEELDVVNWLFAFP